ncbi:MAG: response regulator [Candidatus Methanoperedens sp.]
MVEDDPINMELVLEIIKSVGFRVDAAVNGEEAVRKTEKEAYDLILMDIMLPGMDGIETTRIIKSKPGYKNTPVIALTAYAMKGDREKLLEKGFEDYVPKPLNVPELIEKLNKYR